MDYVELYKLLNKNRLITPIWEHILSLVHSQIVENTQYNEVLIILSIYFSFIDDGNICLSLDKETLLNKWNNKLDATKILLSEDPNFDEEEYNKIYEVTNEVINNHLSLISEDNLPTIIGDKKIFEIEDNYLYTKKFNETRKSIRSSLLRIFSTKHSDTIKFNVGDIQGKYGLTKGQEDAFNKGIESSLIITGGPGTGKTTSILYLLFNIIGNNEDRKIYLAAPSGKASNRMKESIIDGLKDINPDFKNEHIDYVDKITNLKSQTIHSLLSMDVNTGKFKMNSENQFEDDSVFIIDEASMNDISLFSILLEAIPTNAKVYIMGDKDQLPSVDSGAVFGELLKIEEIKENIIYLTESMRFKQGSTIHNLATAINEGATLPVNESDSKEYTSFEVLDTVKGEYPVYYYLNTKDTVKDIKIIRDVVYKWGNAFIKDIQSKAINLDENDYNSIVELYNLTEVAKILTAENEGIRGVKKINSFIKTNFIDSTIKSNIADYYPGEVMMINKNDKILELNNGDPGVLVTFKNDPNLYLMVRNPACSIVSNDGKTTDRIFKLKDFVFYPFRLIDPKNIDDAWAISIHKSQGSGYSQILVILPSKAGHPLLNRQIVYTAITRTKGNTYILSNQKMLECARDTLLERDTNIA